MRPAQPEVTSPLTNMDELDRGWSWVVLAASFGYFMIFGMLLYGVGIVHVTLLEEYDKPSSATAWAGSLYASLVSLGGPLSSLIIDRWSCRTAMFIDGVLTTVGLLSSAFSPSLYLVIFTYGILAGFGGGIGYTATMMVVGFNFRRWRNTALGVAISGVGVGTCIFSPILELLCGLYGRRGYFIMLAGISLHKCLFAVLCRPSRLERARQRSLKTNDEAPLSKSQIMKLYANVYANKLIICFSLSLMLFSVGTYMIFLHLPAVAVSKGHSRMTAALLLSACGASTILARIMTTFVSEKKSVDGIVLYSGSFGSLALATFLFPIYSRTLVGLVIFSAILGAYFGGCYAVMNSINIHLVGLKFLNIATGVELVFTAIGTAIGPIVTGIIVDRGGTFEHAFMVAAFVILIGAALGMATVVFQPNNDKPDVPDTDYVISNNGDVNETVSSMLNSVHIPNKRFNLEEINEKQETETQEFTAEQKSASCSGSACSLRNNIFNVSADVDFSEEIQRLFNGEELKFIDES